MKRNYRSSLYARLHETRYILEDFVRMQISLEMMTSLQISFFYNYRPSINRITLKAYSQRDLTIRKTAIIRILSKSEDLCIINIVKDLIFLSLYSNKV